MVTAASRMGDLGRQRGRRVGSGSGSDLQRYERCGEGRRGESEEDATEAGRNGRVGFVAAIDNEDDRMIYAGPIFSYYEFAQPVEDRLTDAVWETMLRKGKQPSRPAWVGVFQGPRKKRELVPRVPR